MTNRSSVRVDAERLQGIVFCAVALVTVVFSVLLTPMNPQHETVLLALLVVLLALLPKMLLAQSVINGIVSDEKKQPI